jgi:hypothetical protein
MLKRLFCTARVPGRRFASNEVDITSEPPLDPL